MKSIITVDPGAAGGIAFRVVGHADGATHTYVIPMPSTRGEAISEIKHAVSLAGGPENVVMYHEDPSTFIPGGGASNMCNYGMAIERCACIAETLGVRLIMVRPQKWQPALGLGKSDRVKVPKKGEASEEEIKAAKRHNEIAKREWKAKLQAEAQRRYPTCKVTLKTADALLILDYAIEQEK